MHLEVSPKRTKGAGVFTHHSQPEGCQILDTLGLPHKKQMGLLVDPGPWYEHRQVSTWVLTHVQLCLSVASARDATGKSFQDLIPLI